MYSWQWLSQEYGEGEVKGSAARMEVSPTYSKTGSDIPPVSRSFHCMLNGSKRVKNKLLIS